LPHFPQLLGSFPVSMQVPLQSTVGGGHGLAVQAPPAQPPPAGQVLPQLPQLFGSVCVSVHTPLHCA
jgi:hypothetical protein